MQDVWIIHHGHPTTSRRGNEIVCHGKRTQNNQKQRVLSGTNHHNTR